MEAVVNFFKGIGDWFKWAFEEIWGQVAKILWSWWSMVLAVFATVYAFFETVLNWVSGAVVKLLSITFPSSDLSLSAAIDYLAYINVILPVEEMLTFIVFYVGFMLLLTLYKGVKSLKSWVWAG